MNDVVRVIEAKQGLPEHVEAFGSTPASELDTFTLWLLMVSAVVTASVMIRIAYRFKRFVYQIFDRLWPATPESTALAIVKKIDAENDKSD